MKKGILFILFAFSIFGVFGLGAFLGAKIYALNDSMQSKSPDKIVQANAAAQNNNKNQLQNGQANSNSNTTSDTTATESGNPSDAYNSNGSTSTAQSSDSQDINQNQSQKPGIAITINSLGTNGKVAYLTFDDGPTYTTPEILNILDSYHIKATFFVVGSMCKNNPSILKREFNDGEYICNHTYSHNYSYIYANSNNFIADVKKCSAEIESILGSSYKPALVRFPGGTTSSYLTGRSKLFEKSLLSSGYSYVDWNALSGDADARNVPVNNLIENVKRTVGRKNKVIILMHDCAIRNTVTALPQIIEYLKTQGYSFSTLKDYVK